MSEMDSHSFTKVKSSHKILISRDISILYNSIDKETNICIKIVTNDASVQKLFTSIKVSHPMYHNKKQTWKPI